MRGRVVVRAAMLCALVVATVAPAPAADGDIPERAPVSGGTVKFPVFRGMSFDIFCVSFDPPAASMEAYSLTDARGHLKRASWTIASSFSSSNIYIQARVGPQGATKIVQRYPSGSIPSFSQAHFTVSQPGTLRVAWASWGGGLRACFVLLNRRVQILPDALDPSHALFQLPGDLPGGAGLTGTEGGASAQQLLTRTTKGYLFGIFAPEMGVAHVDAPSGRRFDSTKQTGPYVIAEATRGAWRYGLDASISQTGNPVLWLLELPA